MILSHDAKNKKGSNWEFHKSAIRRDLVERFPVAIAALDSAMLDRVVTDISFCKCKLKVTQIPNSVHPRIVLRPDPHNEVLTEYGDAIRSRFRDFFFTTNQGDVFGLSRELAASVNMAIRSFVGRVPTDEINRFVEYCSKFITGFTRQIEKLAKAHRKAINLRDLPGIDAKEWQLSKWLVAPELSGRDIRPAALQRRAQACEVYGFLWNTLMNPEVTKAIDSGKPLASILMNIHGLRPAELKAIQGKLSIHSAIAMTKDLSDPIRLLKEYRIPLHEWPKTSGANNPWHDSEWMKTVKHTSSDQIAVSPIRLDYLADQEIKDAINSLTLDLLIPLFRKEAPDIYKYTHEITIKGLDASRSAIRRKLIADLGRIVLGKRKQGGLKAAATLWHRRVASLAALRHERGATKKGWPKLCDPWQSRDKRWTLTVINSAAGLVEEGNRMRHCVGGHYNECRSGQVHILSLRRDNANVATVEIRLPEMENGREKVTVTQFKGHRNEAPPPEARAAMREFLKDTSTGAHRLNLEIIRKYREKREGYFDWDHQLASVEDARKLYEFYRVLLPRGCPPSYDEWIEQSGLLAAVKRCIEDSAKLVKQVERKPSANLLEMLAGLGIQRDKQKFPDASL